MAEPLRGQYYKVLTWLQGRMNRRSEKSFGYDMIAQAWKEMVGVKNEVIVWNNTQDMVKYGYLLPVRTDLDFMNRTYQIGEEGLILMSEEKVKQ